MYANRVPSGESAITGTRAVTNRSLGGNAMTVLATGFGGAGFRFQIANPPATPTAINAEAHGIARRRTGRPEMFADVCASGAVGEPSAS